MVNRIFSVRKFIEPMLGAFLIVLPFLKNSYRPASDIAFLIDIYLRLKRIEHKWGIRYFFIYAKAGWCHRLEVLLFKIKSVSCQWFKNLCSEIQEMSLFSKLILMANLEDLNNILMCFFLGKFISKRHEYLQKFEKFNSNLWIYILFLTTHAI